MLHEAGSPEHDDIHSRGSVGDGGLHNGGRTSTAGTAGGRTHHFSLNGGLLPVGQGAQVGQLAPGVVAARQEPQQLSGRPDALFGQFGQLIRSPLAQEPVQRTIQQWHRTMCGRGSRAHSHLLQGQENIGARLTACVDDHLNGVGIPQDPFSVVRDGLGDERADIGHGVTAQNHGG